MNRHSLRARAIAAVLVAAAVVCAAKGTPVTKERFESNYALWQAYIARPEIQMSSNPGAYVDCATYKAIAALGPKALPFLVEKMRAGAASDWKQSEFFLWRAAKKVSGVDLAKKGEAGVSEQEMARRYVAWYDASQKTPR